MKLDKELIEGKIDIIDRNIKFLAEYNNIKNNEFINTYKDVQAVKYSLFESIEACIDISSHIISVKEFQRAESYSEMFEILGEKNILDTKLAIKLADMAKFRNILIHGYARIDNEKVLNYVKEDLKDIKIFVKRILEIIKESKS